MKKLVAVIIVLLTMACSSKKEGNMQVTGKIKGLKKGTLYLQKIKDTALISVDSVNILGGDETFLLVDNVDSPEMYYLTLDGNVAEKKIMFFGEPTTITIEDNVKEFGWKPIIKGSKNQEVMEEYNKVNQQFKLKRLDYIAKDIEARAKKDKEEESRLQEDYKKFVRKRFLFTTNFAIAKKDFEAAPYIALSELFDANMYLLDTVNNSLSEKVKKSLYGKELQSYIDKIKEKNTQRKEKN